MSSACKYTWGYTSLIAIIYKCIGMDVYRLEVKGQGSNQIRFRHWLDNSSIIVLWAYKYNSLRQDVLSGIKNRLCNIRTCTVLLVTCTYLPYSGKFSYGANFRIIIISHEHFACENKNMQKFKHYIIIISVGMISNSSWCCLYRMRDIPQFVHRVAGLKDQ